MTRKMNEIILNILKSAAEKGVDETLDSYKDPFVRFLAGTILGDFTRRPRKMTGAEIKNILQDEGTTSKVSVLCALVSDNPNGVGLLRDSEQTECCKCSRPLWVSRTSTALTSDGLDVEYICGDCLLNGGNVPPEVADKIRKTLKSIRGNI